MLYLCSNSWSGSSLHKNKGPLSHTWSTEPCVMHGGPFLPWFHTQVLLCSLSSLWPPVPLLCLSTSSPHRDTVPALIISAQVWGVSSDRWLRQPSHLTSGFVCGQSLCPFLFSSSHISHIRFTLFSAPRWTCRLWRWGPCPVQRSL